MQIFNRYSIKNFNISLRVPMENTGLEVAYWFEKDNGDIVFREEFYNGTKLEDGVETEFEGIITFTLVE